MAFARPEYLNLLWGLAGLALLFAWSFRNRRRRLAKIVNPLLADRVIEEFSRSKAMVRAALLIGFFACGILAIARPQWGARMDTVHRRGVDLMVALDASYSMNAEDVAPNRLEKAKGEIRRLIEKSEGDRIGLVAFSGSAVLQCPLTLDHGAAELFLDVAHAGMIPKPGTSLASAIETATAAFIAKERKYKVLALFTDGEDLEGEVDDAIRKARDAGVIIYTIGIGTPVGTPIPVHDAKGNIVEYKKDEDGQVVVSSLDERSLAEIATKTGGRYFRATTPEGEIDALHQDISRLEKKELESSVFRTLEDRFQYPLALGIVFLAAWSWMTERRRPGAAWRERLNRWRRR